MSWSEYFNGVKGKDVHTQQPHQDNTTSIPEVRDQFGEALAVAQSIIDSGVVGDSSLSYNVVLSGHGNPDHQPASGWANDYVSVSVYQLTEDDDGKV